MKKLLRIGGKDLALLKDNQGYTALMYGYPSEGMIDLLLQTGGKDLVKSQDNNGNTFFHCFKIEQESYLKVLDIGGKEVLMLKNQQGQSALHCLCTVQVNEKNRVKMIDKFIRVGGKDLVCMKDNYGATALHYECSRSRSDLVIVRMLLEVSAAELGVQVEALPLFDSLSRNQFINYDNIEKANKALLSKDLLNPVQCLVVFLSIWARGFEDDIDVNEEDEENSEDGEQHENDPDQNTDNDNDNDEAEEVLESHETINQHNDEDTIGEIETEAKYCRAPACSCQRNRAQCRRTICHRRPISSTSNAISSSDSSEDL